MFFIKGKKHVFLMFFYSQVNVFIIYALNAPFTALFQPSRETVDLRLHFH